MLSCFSFEPKILYIQSLWHTSGGGVTVGTHILMKVLSEVWFRRYSRAEPHIDGGTGGTGVTTRVRGQGGGVAGGVEGRDVGGSSYDEAESGKVQGGPLLKYEEDGNNDST